MAINDNKKLICPRCKNKEIIRYGWQQENQIYFCKVCKKKFRTNKLKNKTYSPKIITNAITYYNSGYSLNETVKLINRRFKVKISAVSVHYWIKEFKNICSYWKLRPAVMKKYNKAKNKVEVIESFSFKHSGLTYDFMYHIPKLEMLSQRFISLSKYLKSMKELCPSDLFNENQRCSQLKIDISFKKMGKYNQACQLADLALKACFKNRQRHNFVENFMILNDSCTVACEVPVWFWEKNFNLGICGHIDILQIRKNKIYVLDFKPEAFREKEKKVASQLYFYASGLSFRTKIPLKFFRCAWFDENVYYEFDPMNLDVKISK